MAKITIEGAKVTDQGVEMKHSSGGKEYASFTVMWSSSRKDRNTGDREYGPTKFVRVMAFGFQAGDIAANVKGGDRVNVTGNIDHFIWHSQNGEKDDWTMFADSVSLPVPRAQQGGGSAGGWNNANSASGGPSGGSAGDPWNSGPQGGFGGAQDDQAPF